MRKFVSLLRKVKINYYGNLDEKDMKNDKNFWKTFEGCPRYIFANLFLSLNESTCQTWKIVFYFTGKVLFILEKIKSSNSTFSHFVTSSNA